MSDGSCCAPKSGDQKSCCGMKCTPNVGMFDRLLRMAGGTALVTLAATSQIGPWGFLGVLLIASSVLGYCGMYKMCKMDTTKCCGPKGTDTPPTTPV